MVVLGVVAVAARRSGIARLSGVSALAQEVALISGLYMLWRLARQLPLTHEEGAYDRGRQIWDLQRFLHLPSELTMERIAIDHRWLGELTVTYYATLHVPGLLIFLVWLWVRHRDRFPRWRNVLALTTGFCLFIRFIRVAPPRLMPELGFVDLPALLGRDIYGPVGTGASDQFAAMPSIHIAWAVIVAFGALEVSSSKWRWIGMVHLVLTFWAVMATANHWWMDGLVAIALVGASMAIDTSVRRRFSRLGAHTDPSSGPQSPELVATG